MSSQTDIVNQAQILIGDDLVVSINDNTKQARTMKVLYDMIRQGELRAHRWKFSMTRQLLPAMTTPPENTPFTYGYLLPSNCLKVLDINHLRQSLGSYNYRSGLEKLYEFQGNVLLTNIPAPITLHYIQDVTDTTMFDACFVNAFSAKLAWKAAYALSQATSIKNMCLEHYKDAINEATRTDAIEKLPEGQAEDSWVTSRL